MLVLAQCLPVAHVSQVKDIYSSKPVKISHAWQANKFLFMLSISNINKASVILTVVFPLLLLKNKKTITHVARCIHRIV